MNYIKKFFIFYISIIFSPCLQGFDKSITLSQASAILRKSSSFPQQPNVRLTPSQASAVLQSGIEAIEKAPYALDKHPLEDTTKTKSKPESRSPNSLTFSTCNDKAYCIFYIPFNDQDPTIEMGIKTPFLQNKPSEYVFSHKICSIFRGSEGESFRYVALLNTFNYKVNKKSYKFISSSTEGDQYNMSDAAKKSLITKLTAIKNTIEESREKSEPTDEKTISSIS